jgi:hypothetical protein
MKIVIDEQMVWLDDDANSLLAMLKSTMTEDEVVEWLQNWFDSVVVTALLGEEAEKI